MHATLKGENGGLSYSGCMVRYHKMKHSFHTAPRPVKYAALEWRDALEWKVLYSTKLRHRLAGIVTVRSKRLAYSISTAWTHDYIDHRVTCRWKNK